MPPDTDSIFIQVKSQYKGALFLRTEQQDPEWAHSHRRGIDGRTVDDKFMVCLGSLRHLVYLQSEDISAVNSKRDHLDLGTAQTQDRVQRIPNS